ncbi:hypothetical protein WK68_20325 [Burkholderia ubonensis]|nr:hypothetical protein WK68_20325 [Burkholderia ubonensis]
MKYPPIERLVLSGGGAKGAAYPGAALALEDGGVMPAIKSISGSSAGAISAALLAAGVSGGEFRDLSNSMDFLDLIRQRVGPPLFQAARHINEDLLREIFKSIGRRAPFARNIASGLVLLSNMQTSAPALEQLLKNETRASILRHLAAHTATEGHSFAVDEIRTRLEGGGDVTFSDLRRLSQCIPAIKDLRCTGTMMEKKRPQLMVFSADTTPDLSIARAACISGSFPFVFAQPREMTPFGTAHYQDGGVMLNVPASEIFVPESVNRTLPHPDSLILTFMNVAEQSSLPAQGILGAAKDWLVGAPVGAQHALEKNALRKLRDEIVKVPMKNERGNFSGTINGTLNFGMSLDDKLALQRDLKDEVERHLATRREKTISIEFPSKDEALLALDEKTFNELRTAHPELTAGLHAFRAETHRAIGRLSEVLQALDNIAPDRLPSLVSPLDQLCSGDQGKLEFVARQIVDAAQPKALTRIVDVLRHAPANSPLLRALSVLSEKQDVANAACNAIRDVVYPARFRLGQSTSNHALLNLVENRLTSAATRVEYNAALELLAQNYEGYLSGQPKPLISNTVRLAKDYQIRI